MNGYASAWSRSSSAGPEEELVGLRTGQEHHLLAGQLEDADVAALLADPLHQPDRVGAELFEVAVLFFPAGYPRNGQRWS